MQETQVRSLGQEDPLEKEMATHSSTLAWIIPWKEEHTVHGVAKELDMTEVTYYACNSVKNERLCFIDSYV